MRRLPAIAVGLVLAAASACSDERTYALHGQVLSVQPDRQQATIKHEEIKGLMPAMTMPYRMKNPKLLDGIAPGDLISGTLAIVSNDAYLTAMKKVGSAPLEKPPAEAPAPPPSGVELLKPGDPIPNARFVDQDGRKRDIDSLKGSTLLITFMYTACPLPTFCPLMDRHFATIQTAVKGDPSLKNVHLVSISFDPAFDTPPVLKKHALELKADPARWTFFTGERDDIDRFASRFGIAISRALNDERDITHNLRTASVDPAGKLVKVYTGNEWTPEQLLADVRGTGVGPSSTDSRPPKR